MMNYIDFKWHMFTLICMLLYFKLDIWADKLWCTSNDRKTSMIVYITCTAVSKRLIRFANKHMSLAGREVVSGKTVSEVLSTSGSRAHTTDLTQRISKQYRSEKKIVTLQWFVGNGLSGLGEKRQRFSQYGPATATAKKIYKFKIPFSLYSVTRSIQWQASSGFRTFPIVWRSFLRCHRRVHSFLLVSAAVVSLFRENIQSTA